jgi:ABC-type transporter MlaC component
MPFIRPLNPRLTDWHGKTVWLVGASSGIGAATAHAGSPAEAQTFIDTVAGDVLAVIKTDDSQSVKMGKLEGIFSTAVDIPYVGKYVLGRHWNTAKPQQQRVN